MSRWRPSPDEERWLAVASRLRAALPAAAVSARTGGWRSAGLLARIALFVLGILAALLLYAVLGFRAEPMMLLAGLAAALAAEWLTLQMRLHASGIEEGLTVAGFMMASVGVMLMVWPDPLFSGTRGYALAAILAAGAAGWRRLNPVVTTGATIAGLYWFASTDVVRALDQSIGAGLTALATGCALAALALALGARRYRRPSHDRMLDWLVATLPVAVYAQYADWSAFGAAYLPGGGGTPRFVAIALLLALAAALLATGLRRRRHAPLWGFLGCAAALAIELRASIAVAQETWLIGAGLVALAAGVALDRALREPRSGVTSTSLTRREGPLDLLQIAGSALLARHAAPEGAPPEAKFEGEGGRFGGGGASGNY